MTLPALPPQGSTSWYSYMQGLDAAARSASGSYAATVGPSGSGAKYETTGTDDHVQWQAAVDAVAAQPTGGVVFIKAGAYTCGTVTLKQGVSILAETGAVVTLKSGAGTFLLADQFTANAGSGNAWNGIHDFIVQGLTINGNSANQTSSGATDHRGRNALIKLYGYRYTLRDLRLNDSKEIALYTEHDYSWDGDLNAQGQGFNERSFGESVFENIFAKSYGVAGWVHRGPHDSHARSVYLSSYNVTGLNAVNGFVLQLSTTLKFGSVGFVADNLHAWGEHSDSSVLLDNANITQGKIYAEGATVAAIRITGNVGSGYGNNFEAVVDWAPVGLLIDNTCNDSVYDLYPGSHLTSSVVKILGGSAGNLFRVKRGTVPPGAFVYDLNGYNGNGNSFVSGHAWQAAQFLGGPNVGDRVDVVSDNFPDNLRNANYSFPVSDTRFRITNGGVDLGNLPLIFAGGINQLYGTAPPTQYTWPRGSIIWNSAPTAAGPPGWMCVTAGTPGTWKAMGNLAA